MNQRLQPGTRVYLACKPVDMRKGLNGLVGHVSVILDVDPYSGHLFLFRGKKGDYLKLVYWDGSGLCLFAKRFEKGRFVWPSIIDSTLSLTHAQLALLVEGIDWRRTIAPSESQSPAFA